MKKSNMTFFGICLLAGLINPCNGGLTEILYVVASLSIASVAMVLVKNKYEKV